MTMSRPAEATKVSSRSSVVQTSKRQSCAWKGSRHASSHVSRFSSVSCSQGAAVRGVVSVRGTCVSVYASPILSFVERLQFMTCIQAALG